MSLRREFLSHLGASAIGVMGGYYVGAKKILGIQSDKTQKQEKKSRKSVVIDDFEKGELADEWYQPARPPTGREAFSVQSFTSPEGQYALKGESEGLNKFSAIRRDDFLVNRDGDNIKLFVKLGGVLSGAERANKVFFMEDDTPLILIDQKNRPHETAGAHIGNDNSPNSDLNTVKQVEFKNIRFSDNVVGEISVSGNTVVANASFMNPGAKINGVKIWQGHFGQPDDIIVDGITYTTESY